MHRGVPKTDQNILNYNEERDPEFVRIVTSNNNLTSRRVYYPLKHHQKDFDELERIGGRSQLYDQYNLSHLVDRGLLPPPHTVSVILKCAILGSPKQKLTLKEIRIAMIRRFLYFKESENDGWCNTVRHTLSIESDFISVKRPRTNEDAGSWWMLSSIAEPPDMRPGARASPRSTIQQISREESPRARPLRPKKGREEPIWVDMTSSFSSLLSSRNSTSTPKPPPSTSRQNMPPSSTDVYLQSRATSPSICSNPRVAYPSIRHNQSSSAHPSSSSSRLPSIRTLGLLELGTAHLSTNQTRRHTDDDCYRRQEHYLREQQTSLSAMARDRRTTSEPHHTGRPDPLKRYGRESRSDTEMEHQYFYPSGR